MPFRRRSREKGGETRADNRLKIATQPPCDICLTFIPLKSRLKTRRFGK